MNERPCNGFLCPLFSLAHIRQKLNRVRKVTTYFLFTFYLPVSNEYDFGLDFSFAMLRVVVNGGLYFRNNGLIILIHILSILKPMGI